MSPAPNSPVSRSVPGRRTPARRLPLALLVAVLGLVGAGIALPAPALAAGIASDQYRLNTLGCDAGPNDGQFGEHTKAAVLRFQSRHGLSRTGRLDDATRTRLHGDRARDCRKRPLPWKSGSGRRIVISQSQNWVWLVDSAGRTQAQAGMIDNPQYLDKGTYTSGSKCGRPARVKRNSDGGDLWLYYFSRFAPCGIGFHQVPVRKASGDQIHPDWLLGTDLRASHGCMRLSRTMVEKVWSFTQGPTKVVVV